MSVPALLADTTLPPRPDPSVWPYLDAAARCIERFGWERTSVRDVAREAGVERTTIYRHVGSMDDIFRLLVARELHQMMDALPTAVPPGVAGPDFVVEVVAAAVEHALAHPVLAKILSDEPEVIARLMASGIADLVARVATTIAPMLRVAMDGGLIAQRDPVVVTEWVVRTGLSLLVVPPPIELRAFLREVLDPVLRIR
jgi:AcrR family transcriptional regulator